MTRVALVLILVLAATTAVGQTKASTESDLEEKIEWAREKVAQADTIADPVVQRQVLRSVCVAFLKGSVPGPDAPCDDPGWTTPSGTWPEYLRIVRRLLASESCDGQGVRPSFVLLVPRFVSRLSDLDFWPRAIHGSLYRVPLDLAQESVCSTSEEIVAVAGRADYELTDNWPEACRLYIRAHRLADSLGVKTSCNNADYLALQLLDGEFVVALRQARGQLQVALDVRINQTGQVPSVADLVDPPTLWALLLPYLGQAMAVDADRCYEIQQSGFAASPLATVPGVRPKGLRTIKREIKDLHLLEFREVNE